MAQCHPNMNHRNMSQINEILTWRPANNTHEDEARRSPSRFTGQSWRQDSTWHAPGYPHGMGGLMYKADQGCLQSSMMAQWILHQYIHQYLLHYQVRDHPFKASACSRGEGVKNLPNLVTDSTKKIPMVGVGGQGLKNCETLPTS